MTHPTPLTKTLVGCGVGFACLLLAGWWAFSVFYAPARVAVQASQRLTEGAGLPVRFERALRTGPSALELHHVTYEGSLATLTARRVLLSGGPGFAPPYTFTVLDPVLAIHPSRAGETAGPPDPAWAATKVHLRGALVRVEAMESLGGVGFVLDPVDAVLTVSGDAGSSWRAQGTIGQEGSFACLGRGWSLAGGEFSFPDGADFNKLAGLLVWQDALPLPLEGEGTVRLHLVYAPGDKQGALSLHVDFRDLRPGFWPEATWDGYGSVRFLRGGAGLKDRGLLHVDRVKVRGLDFTRCTASLEGEGATLKIRNIRGRVLGGQCHGMVSLSFRDAGSATLALVVRDGEAAAVPPAWLGSTKPFSGRLSLGVNGELEKLFEPGPCRFIGTGHLGLADANLVDLPLVGGLDRYMNLALPFSFHDMQADFTFDNEGIRVGSAHAQTALFRLELARPGAVFYDKRMDLTLLLKRPKVKERKFPVFTKLKDTVKKMFLTPLKGFLTLRIRIFGTLMEPKYQLLMPGKK